MSDSSSDSNAIWRFIPVSDYKVPTEPPAERIRTGLVALWHRLRRGATTLTAEQDTEETEEEEDIQQDPGKIAPWPEWTDAGVDALDDALESWRAADVDRAGSRVLVAPPHSHVEMILEAWAKRHDYRILEPPTYGDILQEPERWLDQLPLESGAPFVLVALERCYLRHYNGLDLVRRLVQRLWQANQPCVLGCDSWAWAYLDFACQISMLDPAPLTLAPLDAPAISRWIATASPTPDSAPDSAAHTANGGQLPVYRRMDSGVLVYPIHDEHAPQNGNHNGEDTDKVTSEFLVHIAAHARGIPGVAWALWRKSLALTQQHEVKSAARKAAAQDPGTTVWVKKWETVELPAIPARLSDLGAFALHAILLHGGLRFEEIEYLVPGGALQIAHDLRALEAAQIISSDQGRFYVTPQGYPTARAFLQEEAFMIGALG
ncbi:MAG: hypothetical protein WDZ49_13955 [Litorilinea sp.]